MALAASGEPTRFLTLTVNPRIGRTPYDRLRQLTRAWRVIVQRLRRMHANKSIDYLAIVEETKQGEPHLHILLRSPYIPQALLSSWMGGLLNSPIVDIRLIRNQAEVVKYVAKYVTKAPAQFGTAKRYWCSRTYELDQSEKPQKPAYGAVRWHVDRRPLFLIMREWIMEGFMPRFDGTYPVRGFPSRSPPSERVEAPGMESDR